MPSIIKTKKIEIKREDKRVIVYLDEKKKWYLIYSNIDDLMKCKEPFDCTDLPLQRLNDIAEKWIIKKVTYTKAKLVMEFEKLK